MIRSLTNSLRDGELHWFIEMIAKEMQRLPRKTNIQSLVCSLCGHIIPTSDEKDLIISEWAHLDVRLLKERFTRKGKKRNKYLKESVQILMRSDMKCFPRIYSICRD